MRKFRIVLEGRPYEVEVEEISGEASPVISQSVPAPAVQAPVITAPSVAAAPIIAAAPAIKPAANLSGGVQMKSPMPGTIIGLKVSNGAKVKKGEIVLVLEAMKMENDIAASAEGIITFNVDKGATVNSGEILAVIA